MNYLIIDKRRGSFYTSIYDYENHYRPGVIIVDLINHLISFNGAEWDEINFDVL